MKHRLSILMIILFANFSIAQQPNYESFWEKVNQFETKGLPKSALNIVDAIEKQAIKDKNHPQLIKTMLFKNRDVLESF